MPLYIACVFAGLLAESKVGAGEVGLNTFIAGFLAVRVAYTVNYLNTESQKYTYLRSLLYFVNVGQVSLPISTRFSSWKKVDGACGWTMIIDFSRGRRSLSFIARRMRLVTEEVAG